MQCSAYLLLAYFTIYVAAFDLYGGYERMFYYYAYLIDGGKLIAPNCNKSGGLCSFNQFIQYITKGEGDKMMPLPKITDDKHPKVDETAKKLNDMKLNGQYVFGKIINGPANVEQLFGKVVNAIKYIDLTTIDPELRTNAHVAIATVYKLRAAARSQKMAERWRKDFPGIDIRTVPQQTTPGKTEEIIDTRATKRANLQIWDQVVDSNIAADLKDPTHANNVRTAGDAMKALDPNRPQCT